MQHIREMMAQHPAQLSPVPHGSLYAWHLFTLPEFGYLGQRFLPDVVIQQVINTNKQNLTETYHKKIFIMKRK